MTLSLYIQCVAMFILGQSAHLVLVKIPSLRLRAGATNKKYIFIEWWNCDWNVIIGTQIIGAMVIIGLDQIVKWKPEILDYVKWFFSAVGAFGSTIAMAKFSQYEKSLTDLFSVKSNVSDAVTGGTTTVRETIAKGSEATGQDVSQSPKM